MGENLLPLPEQDVQITGSNNSMNGHDNGVNVNVNVLGIQEKKNVEKSGNLNIDGDNNSMNGHDNGVNVNVNVLGIQAIKNLASGSAQCQCQRTGNPGYQESCV